MYVYDPFRITLQIYFIFLYRQRAKGKQGGSFIQTASLIFNC